MTKTNHAAITATVEPRAPLAEVVGSHTLEEAIRRFGHDTVAFQGLAPGMQAWSDGAGGWVTYMDTGSAWLAVGSPLCPGDDMSRVARDFVNAARMEGRRAGFCAAEAFSWEDGFARFPLGQQPIWDPRKWGDVLAGRRSLREQIRRARAKGVRARVVAGEQIAREMRPEIEALREKWLATRRGGALGYLLSVHLFHRHSERFYVVAEQGNRIHALLAAVPVPGRNGFFFEDILRGSDAPNGTVEFLFDATMRALAKEGCGRVTTGLVPFAGPLPFALRLLRRMGGFVFDFDGLHAFRARFAPQSWEPVWFIHPRGTSRLIALWDVAAALTAGRPIQFALRAWRQKKRSAKP